MNENIITQFVANDGTKVILYPTSLVLDRTKAFSVAVGVGINAKGVNSRTIPLHSIQAVDYREGKKTFFGCTLGVLQFVIAGGAANNNTFAATARDSNSVNFEPQYNDQAFKIKRHIDEFIANPPAQSATVIQQTSAADELKKFKELLDCGIITQEEFDAKKKQLLGL